MDALDHYVIEVGGQLGPEWSAWLAGMAITNRPGGIAQLDGRLPDQAALFGVLLALRDLGLPVLSLTRAVPQQQGDSPCGPSGS